MITTRAWATVAAWMVLLAALAGGGQPEAHAADPPPSQSQARLDINRASAGELIAVPGIGQVTADRIVQWRKEHGPFKRVEDLMKVKGIGERSLDKIRPYVKVGDAKGG